MVTYQYRCDRDGIVEIRFPIGTAPDSVGCPRCAAVARRGFTPPLLGSRARPLLAAIDRAEATRNEPSVVSAPPRRPGRPTAAALRNPALHRLPRP